MEKQSSRITLLLSLSKELDVNTELNKAPLPFLNTRYDLNKIRVNE